MSLREVLCNHNNNKEKKLARFLPEMDFSCKLTFLCSLHAALCWQIRNHTQQGWDWDVTGWPQGLVTPEGPGGPLAGIQPVTCGSCVPIHSTGTMLCSLNLYLHSDVATEPHRQKRFGDSEAPLPEVWALSCPSTKVTIHCSPTAASPHRGKRLRPARFGDFPLFLCFTFCSIPVCSVPHPNLNENLGDLWGF